MHIASRLQRLSSGRSGTIEFAGRKPCISYRVGRSWELLFSQSGQCLGGSGRGTTERDRQKILVDVNLLAYAWITGCSVERVGLGGARLLGFVRVITNPRIYERPAPVNVAWG